MSEEKKAFQTWEEVIIDFFENKKKNEEEKYLKDRLTQIGDMYKKQNFLGSSDIELLFDTKKYKKSKDQTAIEFQREKFKKVLKLDNKPDRFDRDSENSSYQNKIKEIHLRKQKRASGERKEVSSFLKMISEYKNKIREIKQKIKEEENL